MQFLGLMTAAPAIRRPILPPPMPVWKVPDSELGAGLRQKSSAIRPRRAAARFTPADAIKGGSPFRPRRAVASLVMTPRT